MYKLNPGIQVAYALGLPVVMAGVANKETLSVTKEPAIKQSSEIGRFVKASHLPIYENFEDGNIYEYHGKEKGMLQDGISAIRKELGSALEITNGVRDNINDIYVTGKAHSLASIEYLRGDENVAARVGAIATGGLLGLIFGIRRGFFKKLIYTSAGAGGTASICYPKEAFELSQDVIYNASDYAVVGYNFLVGVKPQSKDDLNDVKQQPKKQPIPTQVPRSIDSSTTAKAPEVRKPYSLELFAQQASDITVWGFRLKHYDGDICSNTSNHKISKSDAEPQSELIQTPNLDKLEVITKDAMEIIAAKAVDEGAEKVNSVLHDISEFVEKVEKTSENVEKVSSFIKNSAEFVQKETELIHEHARMEKITKELGVMAKEVSSLASEVEQTAKLINTVDHSLIKVDEKIDTFAEAIIANKKEEIVEELEDMMEPNIKDQQTRSFISKIFSIFKIKSKSHVGEEGEKASFISSPEQLITVGSDNNLSNAQSEIETAIKSKDEFQKNNSCDDDQQSAFSFSSSEPSFCETDDKLHNIPIVIIPESQIISDKEKSDYDNRIDQLEMLEDVFINAMLRMQKQDKDAQFKNVTEKIESSNLGDATITPSYIPPNGDPSFEHKKDNESFISKSKFADLSDVQLNNTIQTETSILGVNDKADKELGHGEMKMDDSDVNFSSDSSLKVGETDDLRYIESSGRIFKIPDVMDIQPDLDNQQMTSKTDAAKSNENKQKENAAKDVILKLEKSVKNKIEGDIGQSNPEDKDMYTTRG